VQGFWGFETFTGPTLLLQEAPGKDWKLADSDPLLAGKDRHVVIASTGTACIQSIALDPPSGKAEKETWKPADKPNSVELTLDLPAHDSGTQQLAIRQFGDPKLATVSLVSYNLPAKLDALDFHAGDTTATLTGSSLDQVREVGFGGLTFRPAVQGSGSEPLPAGKSELRLALQADAKPPAATMPQALPAGDHLTAEVALDDGRMLKLPLTVAAARPSVTVIARADAPPATEPKTRFFIKFAGETDLPVSDALMFSLKSARPFPRNGTLEIASPDGSLETKLSVDSGSLILEDPQTLLATLQPLQAFGPSAFGPIRLRAVAPDGTAGEWLPLVTLVRLPTITGLSCPVAVAQPSGAASAPSPDPTPAPSSARCTLTGTGLYFLDSVASDDAFANPTRVPDGFVGSSLQVPPPTGARYYLRLRDDPATTDTITLPAGPL
jgi:hypothetical protein